MSTFVVKDTEVAAMVRYVVDREVARHQRMKSEGARHAAVVTLQSFGMKLNDAKSGVAVAMDEQTDPIVKVLGRSRSQLFTPEQVMATGGALPLRAQHHIAELMIEMARRRFGDHVKVEVEVVE